MVKEKEEGKELFFVEVRSPDEVRRNILESLKDIVEAMQRFEKFRHQRKEKLHSIDMLRKDIKEISKLIARLKGHLPEAKLRDIRLKPVLKDDGKGKKAKHKRKKKAEEVKKPVTELDRLESELGAIEEKLRSLQ